jgi:hypothetical protein
VVVLPAVLTDVPMRLYTTRQELPSTLLATNEAVVAHKFTEPPTATPHDILHFVHWYMR